MTDYKCKFCGAEIQFAPNSNICVCPYCDSKNTCANDGVFIGWNPDLLDSNDNSAVEFSMLVEKVFSLNGGITTIVGRVAHGTVNVNDSVRLYSDNGGCIECCVSAIEQFQKSLASANKGDPIGLKLSGIDKSQVSKGDLIIKGELDINQLNERIAAYYIPVGDRAGAVKCYMQTTGLDLKEAREKVDRIFQNFHR